MARRSDYAWQDVRILTERGHWPARGTWVGGWLVIRDPLVDGVRFNVTHPESGRAVATSLPGLAAAERVIRHLARAGFAGTMSEAELRDLRAELLATLAEA